MNKSNWFQITIGFLSGVVFGTFTKQVFDNKRNKIKPIGKSLELNKMRDFNKIVNELKELVSNEFERDLLESSFRNLEDENNALRFNNFAYSIRELSRHILYSLAPNNEVVKCVWYKNLIKDTTNGITRGQRIKYAIQGGLTDTQVNNQIIEISYIKRVQKSLVKSIESMNKYTHINEDTYKIENEQIDKLSNEVIESFKQFLKTIKESKQHIFNKIEENITNELIQHTLWEVKDEIDILATHHNIEGISVHQFNILKIGINSIIINVTGFIDVRLQWGSSGDLRRGDGMESFQDFPFESLMHADFVKKIQYSKITVNEFNVNTDSWYE